MIIFKILIGVIMFLYIDENGNWYDFLLIISLLMVCVGWTIGCVLGIFINIDDSVDCIIDSCDEVIDLVVYIIDNMVC